MSCMYFWASSNFKLNFICRIPIHNEDITYDELILMMQRVFRDQLQITDDLTLKYKDEDGDLITLFDSADLAAAIAYSRVLKLTLFVNGKMVRSKNMHIPDTTSVVKELRIVRDRINLILDCLGDEVNTHANVNIIASDTEKLPSEMNGESEFIDGKSLQDLKLESKEFDPLQKSQFISGSEAAPTPVPGIIPDDQRSVSSATSTTKIEGPQVTVPANVPTTPAAPVIPSSVAQQQTYPGYPSMPGAGGQQPSIVATPYNYQPYPPSAQPQQQQQPPMSQPQPTNVPTNIPTNVPATPAAPVVQSGAQMSAFVGFPQPQQTPIRPAAPGLAPVPRTSAVHPHEFYAGASQRPQGMPMPANPYGMGQRGPNPGFNRYPQPGQGYR